MRFLIESTESKQLITEGVDGQKDYFIEGIFLQSEVKNRNGRIYPRAVMEKEINRYVTEFLDKNRAVGELGHPESPTINYDRVSHKFTMLEMRGNDVYGRAKILNVGLGKIVRGLMDEGITMGISSRALGSLREQNGAKVVQSDFTLITAGDIVSDPSAPDAFVTNLMENKEWIWENGKLIENEKQIKQNINKIKHESLTAILDHILKGNIQK